MLGDKSVAELIEPPKPDKNDFKTILVAKDDLRYMYELACVGCAGNEGTLARLNSITFRIV